MCELLGQDVLTFSVVLLYSTHINTCHVLLLLLTLPCRVMSAAASFKDLVTVAPENSHQPNSKYFDGVRAP